jgi:hypothetical protein
MRPTHLIVALAPNLAQTGCGNTPGGSGATSAGSPAGNGPYEQFARALESRADCHDCSNCGTQLTNRAAITASERSDMNAKLRENGCFTSTA